MTRQVRKVQLKTALSNLRGRRKVDGCGVDQGGGAVLPSGAGPAGRARFADELDQRDRGRSLQRGTGSAAKRGRRRPRADQPRQLLDPAKGRGRGRAEDGDVEESPSWRQRRGGRRARSWQGQVEGRGDAWVGGSADHRTPPATTAKAPPPLSRSVPPPPPRAPAAQERDQRDNTPRRDVQGDRRRVGDQPAPPREGRPPQPFRREEHGDNRRQSRRCPLPGGPRGEGQGGGSGSKGSKRK
jgi:hypothetical protein